MKIDRMKNKRGQPCAAIHGIHGEEKLRLPARTIRLSFSLSLTLCVCVCVGSGTVCGRKWRWVSRAQRDRVERGEEKRDHRSREETRGENRMSDSCATTPPPASSGDYANVIINCQCSLFNDSSSRLLNTPNHRYVTKIAIQVHRCVSNLLIPRRSCITVATIRSSLPFFFLLLIFLFPSHPPCIKTPRDSAYLRKFSSAIHTSAILSSTKV